MLWTLCCHKLPEKPRNLPYLVEWVSNKGDHHVTLGIWTGKKWKLLRKNWWDVASHRVVAWMELPEPSYTPVWENVK